VAMHGMGRSAQSKGREQGNTAVHRKLHAQAVYRATQSCPAFSAVMRCRRACACVQRRPDSPVQTRRAWARVQTSHGRPVPDLVVVQDVLQHLCVRASLRLALSIPTTAVCSRREADRGQPSAL